MIMLWVSTPPQDRGAGDPPLSRSQGTGHAERAFPATATQVIEIQWIFVIYSTFPRSGVKGGDANIRIPHANIPVPFPPRVADTPFRADSADVHCPDK